MSAKQVKGSNVIPLVDAIRKARKAGASVTLTPEDEAFVDQVMLVTKWYPFDVFDRLLHVVHRLAGGTDAAGMKMGKRTAREMLTTVHRPFLHEGDPVRTVRCLELIWKRYFDFGTLRVFQDASGIGVRIEGYPDMSRCHGAVLAGWLEASATLAGALADAVEISDKPWQGVPCFEAQLRYHMEEPRG